MNPHNHRDASLALSVTSTLFLRSVAKHRSRLLGKLFAALRVMTAFLLRYDMVRSNFTVCQPLVVQASSLPDARRQARSLHYER